MLVKLDDNIRDHIPKECWAVMELADFFGCEDGPEIVLTMVFDWYYVPRSFERREYAKRVVKAAFDTIETDATYPDWFWRVHELLIADKDTIGSIPPPLDQK